MCGSVTEQAGPFQRLAHYGFRRVIKIYEVDRASGRLRDRLYYRGTALAREGGVGEYGNIDIAVDARLACRP